MRGRVSPAKRVAVLAIFTALTAAFYPIPFCFLLPITLAACWFDGWTSLVLGAVLGCIGLAMSLIGGSPLALAFLQYPYIAIVPRLLVGISAFGVHKLLTHLTKNSDSMFLKFVLPAALTGLTAALVNTGGVLGMFALCARNAVFENTAMTILIGTWAISGAIEAVVMTLLTPSVDAVGRKILIRTGLQNGR